MVQFEPNPWAKPINLTFFCDIISQLLSLAYFWFVCFLVCMILNDGCEAGRLSGYFHVDFRTGAQSQFS